MQTVREAEDANHVVTPGDKSIPIEQDAAVNDDPSGVQFPTDEPEHVAQHVKVRVVQFDEVVNA